MTRLRMTVVVEYDVHDEDALEDYETTDPSEMAQIDQDAILAEPSIVTEVIEMADAENNMSWYVKVEPA